MMDGLYILHRPGKLRRRLEHLRRKRAVFRDRCAHLTASYGEVRIRGGGGGPDPLARLADADREIDRWERELAAAENRAAEFLARLSSLPGRCGPRDAEILRLRDVRELPWEEVRAELARTGYHATERTMYNWHNAALRRAQCALRADMAD